MKQLNMRSHRTLVRYRLIAPALLLLTVCSCTEVVPPDDQVTVPLVYSFASRFDSNVSSVDYSGQVVRNLLIQDIRMKLEGLATTGADPVTVNDLLARYEYNDASNLQSTTSTGILPPLQASYSSIATGKNLSGKISGATLIGTTMTADQAIRAWFDSVARLSSDPDRMGSKMAYTTDAGIDLTQMIDKVLNGAVSYYQGTGVYLLNVLDKNNADRVNGTAVYTEMEHNWDEAFGYFGAARDYGSFSDAALSGSVDAFVADINGDGKIDFTSEYNYPFARSAGKRDAGATTSIDFTKEIDHEFRAGRAAITGLGTRDDIQIHRDAVAKIWEQVVASSVIHYINETLSDMSGLTAESIPTNSASYNQHWSEMKGFIYALQFNPLGIINATQLAALHVQIGDAPIYAAAGSPAYSAYRAKLLDARSSIQSIFSFATSDVESW